MDVLETACLAWELKREQISLLEDRIEIPVDYKTLKLYLEHVILLV